MPPLIAECRRCRALCFEGPPLWNGKHYPICPKCENLTDEETGLPRPRCTACPSRAVRGVRGIDVQLWLAIYYFVDRAFADVERDSFEATGIRTAMETSHGRLPARRTNRRDHG